MSTAAAPGRQYTEEEIEAMSTPDLLAAYKRTGDEALKWPLVLRYEGLIKNAALQVTSTTRTRALSLRPMWPNASVVW